MAIAGNTLYAHGLLRVDDFAGDQAPRLTVATIAGFTIVEIVPFRLPGLSSVILVAQLKIDGDNL